MPTHTDLLSPASDAVCAVLHWPVLQGAGKVDENLDRTKAAAPVAAAPKGPALPARKGGKGRK